MYYTLLRFPFSSINDEQYMLVVSLNSTGDPTAVTDVLDKEKQLFIRKADTTSGADTVYTYEGILTGHVRVVDDERSDIFEPLVCSKLAFNMAVENFPEWLMSFCNNRRAKVVLYYMEGGVESYGTNHEMWRGYLIDQTLNLTVVNDKLSVPLVAIDEVSMAKYMNFKETLTYITNDHWCSVFGLMEHYYNLHAEIGLTSAVTGFKKLYNIIGLSTTERMLWFRNLRVSVDDSNTTDDIPNTFRINLDRWLQDEKTTWETVFTELFEYLGVTFAIGSYGNMTVNDCYLLTAPNDPAGYDKYSYIFNSGTQSTFSTDVYETLTNPTKYGGNLQMSAEPNKYKKVVVKSEPERWEPHEYLTEEHYKPIDDTKYVRFEWGEGPSTPTRLENYEWHKLKYIAPDDEEADFVTIQPCADGEGYIMARDGDLPYDDLDSCSGKTKPDASVADSLDFITFKEGCCCIKMGQGETGGIDEDSLLKPYFLIMNHNWGNMLRKNSAHTMQTQHISDTNWLTLNPLGTNKSLHPSEKHYLKLKMDIRFIRENFPSDIMFGRAKYLWLKSEGNNPNQEVDWTTPAILMPAESTLYDFGSTDSANDFNANLGLWYDLYFEAYIKIGNFYYNGTTWVYVGPNDTPPKCQVTMWSETTKINYVMLNGALVTETVNYYYTISSPYRGSNVIDRYTNSTKILSSLEGMSIHGQPLHGRLDIQVLGQIRFQNTVKGVGNSVPFVLIDNIESTYTDDAELMSINIENKAEVVIDAMSNTKEVFEKSLKMATPSVAGFFNNTLVYDDGKAWHNVTSVLKQNYSFPTTLEQMKADELSNQYGAGQLFVEFETPVEYVDNVHNVGFRITGLIETSGRFLPVKREFDYTKETMRVKVMRINSMPSL